MLKIRLKRTGKRNAPSYRIVVMDSKKPRDGKAIEELGYYNPAKDPDRVEIDEERLQNWIEKGAQMTEAVEKLREGTYQYEPYRQETEEDGEQEQQPDREREQEEEEEEEEEKKKK